MQTLLSIGHFQLYGIVMLVAGIAIRYFIGRRRFNRRGVGGLQHFANYERAVFITLLERVFIWIANILMLFGAIMIVTR